MTAKNHENTVYMMRPLSIEDVPRFSAWMECLDDLTLFERHSPLPLSNEAYIGEWRKILEPRVPPQHYWYLITDCEGMPVGISGLQNIDYVNGDAVLPVFLSASVRQRGIGTRVGALLLDMAFDHLRLVRVTSYYRDDNGISKKLASGWGFREEGRIRNGYYAYGRHFDTVVVGILKTEWEQQRGELHNQLNSDLQVFLGQPSSRTLSWPEQVQIQTQISQGI